jgi:hypothetical protein
MTVNAKNGQTGTVLAVAAAAEEAAVKMAADK